MTTATTSPGVGGLLRDWRGRRRLSQLELATRAEVSTRHLSYVENGRSRPSRELVLHLARHLDVPRREQNQFHPVFTGPQFFPTRSAVEEQERGFSRGHCQRLQPRPHTVVPGRVG